MSTTQKEKSGVIRDLKRNVAGKAGDVASLILSGKQGDDELALKALDRALQGFVDGLDFEVNILKPKTFGQFLKLKKPTQSIFSQLANKVPDLLNQIEETCFLNEPMIEKARPFIANLWKDKVARNPHPLKPLKDWKYLRIRDAVKAYQHLLGSNLKLNSALAIARKLKPCSESEGIAIWPKLSTLARIFNVSDNPLEDTEKGRKAYAKIVGLFIPKVSDACIKAYSKLSFENWRERRLAVNCVQLTPAGRKAWQKLEEMTNDDFVIALANLGSLYGGHSNRCSRIKITLAGNQFPQDCVMVGATIVADLNRLTKCKHLGIDCPANCYSHGDGSSPTLDCDWDDSEFSFGPRWTDSAHQDFGSASGFFR